MINKAKLIILLTVILSIPYPVIAQNKIINKIHFIDKEATVIGDQKWLYDIITLKEDKPYTMRGISNDTKNLYATKRFSKVDIQLLKASNNKVDAYYILTFKKIKAFSKHDINKKQLEQLNKLEQELIHDDSKIRKEAFIKIKLLKSKLLLYFAYDLRKRSNPELQHVADLLISEIRRKRYGISEPYH